jgi:hypothetical protein
MNAEITYTDFGVTELKNVTDGDYFLWSGNLYQKIEFHWSKVEFVDDLGTALEPEYIAKNVIQTQDGKTFYFYEEERVVPVNVKIEVSREEQDGMDN